MSNFHGNPIEHTDSIALHQIPVVAVCGLADQVVPFKENFQVWQKRFEKQGGRVFLITKKKCDHHPHSLTDPTPVVDFILKANATEPQKPARSSRLRLK
jgi:alpha-beta hydrolase superfamily lysophospholipase